MKIIPNSNSQFNHESYTFVLCGPDSKRPIVKEWQMPDNGLTYAQARAHAGNVGIRLIGDLVCVDIDSDAQSQVERIGDLADTTIVTRSNAPDRAALLFHVDTNPNELRTRKFRSKSRTDKSFDVEILTQASDGGAKHKLICGSFKGGRYRLDQTHPIKRLTLAEYDGLVFLLTDGMVESGQPKTSPQPRPAAHSDDVKAFISGGDVLRVFEHYGRATRPQEESGARIRLLGNGGLIIRTDQNDWYCHSDAQHGDALGAVAYCETGSADTSDPELFKAYLNQLALIVGAEPPPTAAGRSSAYATNPTTGERVPLLTLCTVAEQMIASHKFIGRNSDIQRQVALAYIQRFRDDQIETVHASLRQVADIAGHSTKAVTRTTKGKPIIEERVKTEPITIASDGPDADQTVIVYDDFGMEIERRQDCAETIERPILDKSGEPVITRVTVGYSGECIQDWLIQRVDPAHCGLANVWEFHPLVWETCKNYAHSGNTIDNGYSVGDVHLDDSTKCFPNVHISEIRLNMGSDAYRQQYVPISLRQPKDMIERTLMLNHGWSERDKYLKSFGAMGLAIISQVAGSGAMSVTQLADTLGHHRNSIRAALTRMCDEPAKVGKSPLFTAEISPNDKRVRLYSLADDWREIIKDIAPNMYTYGSGQRQKLRHNSERIELLTKIIPNIQTPELAEQLTVILDTARKRQKRLGFAEWPTPYRTTAAAVIAEPEPQIVTHMLDRILLAMPDAVRNQFVRTISNTSDPAKWAAIDRLKSADMEPRSARVAISAIGNFYNFQIDWGKVTA